VVDLEEMTMADAIVLVHGLASGGAAWAPVAGLLRESGHTVYAPDRLGYGTSPVHPTDYRFGHDVSHLSTFLTENQVDR
jgi:pimeloyl-ACP methyl ester carboxylesterase